MQGWTTTASQLTSHTRGGSASTAVRISHRLARPWAEEDNAGGELERTHSSSQTERPTQTQTDPLGPDLFPAKPKIVVLGASGKIGRLVVQRLLETSSLGDATIVAMVRDYDKACRVLYDDLLVTSRRGKKRGQPQLQIVQADLVPPEELPGFEDQEEDEEWLARASSAASFYGKSVSDYDDGPSSDEQFSNDREGLEEAIRGCTTIISCVGSVRPTNIWSDFLARPLLRILRKDVRGWCSDPRHPYYVNFASTRKALGYAEKEQKRREAVIALDSKDDDQKEPPTVPRIRFIRVSDLCVTQKPWQVVPLLTNIMHSMVFRYQEMAEKLLESSSLIDTVVLRPGDLCDDDREVNTTSLQVDPSGCVPSPSRVGRADVADLAVAATLFSNHWVSRNKFRSRPGSYVSANSDENEDPLSLAEHRPPFHYNFGVRWASDHLHPFPAQGKMSDGFANAKLALQSALRKVRKHEKQKRRKSSLSSLSPFFPTANRRLKPYGICVAVSVYLIFSLLARTAFLTVFSYVPDSGKRWMLPVVTVLKQAAALTAVVVGRMGALARERLVSLSGKAAQQYISF